MRMKLGGWLTLVFLVPGMTGCGGYFARRMAQAPNTYPSWLAPEAPVELAFDSLYLTNFPAHFVSIGPPQARMRYRVVEPAKYGLKVSSTNWLEHGRPHFKFTLRANLSGVPNAWTSAPRGTVVLLHGYGVGMYAMAPWAVRLAEEGWRCVLVDLRGHGKSTGQRIFFGIVEAHDLGQLLETLAHEGKLVAPVMAIGESYGGALALRWSTVEPRVDGVVAIAPYANLSNAVLNICHEYARWLPRSFIRAGLKKLPFVLKVDPGAINTATVLAKHPVTALFVAGSSDKITPVTDVQELFAEAAPGSKLIVVPGATHEAVTYFFNDLVPPVLAWLDKMDGRQGVEPGIDLQPRSDVQIHRAHPGVQSDFSSGPPFTQASLNAACLMLCPSAAK